MSIGLRPCGLQGWAICDGNCEKCQTTATTHTLYDPIEIARQYAPKFDKPAVDMVEVVRCKDCKLFDPEHEGGIGSCGLDMNVTANDYCSKAERKDE